MAYKQSLCLLFVGEALIVWLVFGSGMWNLQV